MDELFQNLLTTMQDCHHTHSISIDKINGIAVDVEVGTVKCKQNNIETTEVSIRVYDQWKRHRMWYRYCEGPTQLQEALDELQTLKYDKLQREFPLTTEPPIRQHCRDLLTYIPEGDNVDYSHQDCAVCLEPTTEKTSCNHHLCKQCETQLKEKKCPICRNAYDHVDRDMQNDMGDY